MTEEPSEYDHEISKESFHMHDGGITDVPIGPGETMVFFGEMADPNGSDKTTMAVILKLCDFEGHISHGFFSPTEAEELRRQILAAIQGARAYTSAYLTGEVDGPEEFFE